MLDGSVQRLNGSVSNGIGVRHLDVASSVRWQCFGERIWIKHRVGYVQKMKV